MKITKIEDLHCDAGWRHFSFLKITTDTGIVGWSEYMERFGTSGLTHVIHGLGEKLIGQDPRPVEKITAALEQLQLRPDVRGEKLSLEQFVALTRILAA